MGSDLQLRWIDGALHLIGEMHLANAHRLDGAVAERPRAEAELVLDLSELGFMDSSACLAILRVFATSARETGMVLRDPSRAARRVLELLSLEDAGIRIALSGATPDHAHGGARGRAKAAL